MIIYNNMAHRSEENINNNLTAIMQSAYHLPRMIICEGDGRGCGTDTESVDTEPSTVVVPGPQNNTAEESREEEEFDNNTAKEEDKEDDDKKEPPSPENIAKNLAELRLEKKNDGSNKEEGDDEVENIELDTTTAILPPVISAASSPPSSPALVSPDKENTTTTITSSASEFTPATPNIIEIEERDELSPLYVGRIIGKGGEMIRDLQARSGCHIDVHQNVQPGEPRIITYRGKSQDDINFAKNLVSMLCNKKDGTEHITLPLGQAIMKQIQVPKLVIGRIIGRRGEMVREVQSKSHARIQIDHGGLLNALDNDEEHRQVTITGTDEAVRRAEEMIYFLSENQNMDGHVYVRQQQYHWKEGGVHHHQHHASVATGHYHHHPHSHYGHHHGHEQQQQQQQQQQQYGMQPLLDATASTTDSTGEYESYWNGRWNASAPAAQAQIQVVANSPASSFNAGYPTGYYPSYQQQQQQQQQPITTTQPIETDVISCEKKDIGHIIGKRGATINDLQHRSNCNIQIDQETCQVTIMGSRHGIELVKTMIHEIIEHEGEYHPLLLYNVVGGQQQQQQQTTFTLLEQHDSSLTGHDSSLTSVEVASSPSSGGLRQRQQQPPLSPQQQQALPSSLRRNTLIPATMPVQQQDYYLAQYGGMPPQAQQHQQLYPYGGDGWQHQHYSPAGSQAAGAAVGVAPQVVVDPYAAQAAAGVDPSPPASLSSSFVVSPPYDWILATTAEGQIYYYNSSTGESRWDNPADTGGHYID